MRGRSSTEQCRFFYKYKHILMYTIGLQAAAFFLPSVPFSISFLTHTHTYITMPMFKHTHMHTYFNLFTVGQKATKEKRTKKVFILISTAPVNLISPLVSLLQTQSACCRPHSFNKTMTNFKTQSGKCPAE